MKISIQATPIFNKLVEIAGKTPRNFILDLTYNHYHCQYYYYCYYY